MRSGGWNWRGLLMRWMMVAVFGTRLDLWRSCGISVMVVDGGIARRAWTFDWSSRVWIWSHMSVVVSAIVLGLRLATTHTNITADPDTAALFCYYAAQRGTFSQAWELLRAVNGEWDGFDNQTEVEELMWRTRLRRCGRYQMALRMWYWSTFIGMLRLLHFLVQVEV